MELDKGLLFRNVMQISQKKLYCLLKKTKPKIV